MQKKNYILLYFNTFLLGIFHLGCAPAIPNGIWINSSPQSENQLGYLVKVDSRNEVNDLVQSHKISARSLSEKSNIYEIYGTDEEEMKKYFPNKKFTKNSFFQYSEAEFTNNDFGHFTKEQFENHLKIINAKEAWNFSKGNGELVSIIDLGLNLNHKDFNGKVYVNQKETYNGFDDDNDGLIDDIQGWNFGDGNSNIIDENGHGTSVASLINSELVGVAPEAKILPLKVINEQKKIDEGSVISALKFVQEYTNSKIINISFGKNKISDFFIHRLNELEKSGILIVASAGNNGLNCQNIQNYPASYNNKILNIISVGASLLELTPPYSLASYSNFGSCVDIIAPAGEDNLSIATPYFANGLSNYILFNGTSAAAPITSGVAALLRSLNPDLKATEIKNIIIESGLNLLQNKDYSKGGILNAYKAIQLLQKKMLISKSVITYDPPVSNEEK